MGKLLKTTKDNLAGLLNVTDQIPATKLASDIGKHLGFRKAIKKHLLEYTDKRSELVNDYQKTQKESLKKQQALEGKEDKKDELAKLNSKLQKETEKVNQELVSITDNLATQKVEITFDNEEFLFEKKMIEENATSIFLRGETFDADRAELILDLLDSVE